MALPVAVGAFAVGTQNSYSGPFKDGNDNIYTVGTSTNSPNAVRIVAFKATDPTSSFTIVSGPFPDFGTVTGWSTVSLNTFQESTNCHIAGQNEVHDVYYARLLTSDAASNPDTYDTPDGTNQEELIDGAPNGTADACDIAVLSASYGVGSAFVKIRAVYQGATDMDMGQAMERIDESNSVDDGVNWSAPTQIDNGAAEAGSHYTGPRIVLPPNNSDQCFIFCRRSATSRIHTRGIAGDDTLRTIRIHAAWQDAGDTYPVTHGIGFDRSGTSKVRIGVTENTTNNFEVLEFDAFVDDTDFTESESTVTTDTPAVDNNSINACLAADGSVIRGLMVKASDDDLYEFFDDDADSYTLQGTRHGAAGTYNHISCNVYDRSGLKLAMIYNDGGTVKYDEISLAVGVIMPIFDHHYRSMRTA